MSRIRLTFLPGFLAAGLLLLAACGNGSATPVPLTDIPSVAIDTSALTVTPSPMIVCTPPGCWEDEVFHCPGECPGGCGTVCATRTPDALAAPTPTMPSFASLCVLPTAVSDAAEIVSCADRENVRVGETVQVAVEIRNLQYSDYVRISGANTDGGGGFSARIRTGQHQATPLNEGAHLILERVQTNGDHLFLFLKAVSIGPVTISFQVIPTTPDLRTTVSVNVSE